ncbi:MAG: ECF transporter S component [Breznakia sp.]
MHSKIKLITQIAIFAAVAAVVMVLDFPLPFFPPFYKLDFSEVIILISGFAFGILPAIFIEAGKVLLSFLLNGTQTMGIGELANFLMGCSFIIPATFLYHRKKTKLNAIIGMGIGIFSLCITASVLNYFILLPIYANAFHMPMETLIAIGSAINPNIENLFGFILLAVVPFNLLKGIVTSITVLFIYKKITHILKK